MLRRFLLLFSVTVVGFAAGAQAQDDVAQGAAPEEAVVLQEQGDSPETEPPPFDPSGDEANDRRRGALLERVVEITKKLDEQQAAHFFVMYSNYSIISMVNNVERDVQAAVQKCADENASLHDKALKRFEAWQKNVQTAREEAKANINNMSLAQNYLTQNEVQALFGMVDETRTEADSRFQRTPVSTPEACEFMLSKMDETEQTMAALLRATLQSYPAALQQGQR